MNIRPLIVRELRAEARRANTYWLRSVAAGLLTALFVWSAWDLQGAGPAIGPILFSTLSEGLQLSILAIVAAIAADSVSREKREGTLGLLFLTPLTAHDIIAGKLLIHLLRSVGIFVAVLPIAGLPFLLGGIPMQSVVFFFGVLPSLVLIAVASGMVASVLTTEWIESIVWAELICALLVSAQWFIQHFAASLITSRLVTSPLVPTITTVIVLAIPFVALIYAAMVLRAAIRFSAQRLEATWQAESIATESRWVKIFSTSAFWRTGFHWNTKKARDRNPIAWLQEYNWSSRLTKWGWCFLLFVAQWRTVLMPFREFINYQTNLYRLVAFGIAFSAAASFRRERQSGALELLLVTPISAGKLILGRLQGVWVHFLPAIAILGCVWILGPQFLSLPLWFSWYLVGAFFCIPVIGFYCSLLTSNVLVAWLLTLLFSQFLPYAITEAFRFDIGRRNVPLAFFGIEAVFALIAGILLYENLQRRRFALKR